MRAYFQYMGVLFLFGSVLLGVTSFILHTPPRAQAQVLSEEEKAKLRAEYDQLQIEIANWQKVLDETKLKKNTLQGDVTLLNAQIKKAEIQIKQRTGTINILAGEINEKAKRISGLQTKLANGHDSLARLIRAKNETETIPLAAIIFAGGSLSEFFFQSDTIDMVNRELKVHFDQIRGVKKETEAAKKQLSDKKDLELNAKHDVELTKKEVAKNEAEKQKLLSITKKDEVSYQKVLAERKQRSAAIRTALFELRDSQGIPFATALQYATQAEAATGVRAAFILGILRQESNLGVNVGQCYLTDSTTGAGKGKNTGKLFPNLMHPTRDVPPFLDLTSRLNTNPYATPVSCPQTSGYGGAMGPSQFIASTWKLYEGRLASALGVTTADPWNARHAVMATSLFLKDLGANKGTYASEREAAGRYYAGGNWQKSGLGYAASVLSYADKYQADITFLKEN